MSHSLPQVASDLKKLAKGKSPGEVAVRALAEKLETRHADLAGVDLAGAYQPHLILPDRLGTFRWLLSALELLRDVLVFVPVAYTWLKIADALAAFEGYRGDEPFLLAWQQGFGGKVTPLSQSAQVIAGVVGVVLVLVVLTHMLRGAYERILADRRRRLAALLAEATLLVTGTLIAEAPGVSKIELMRVGARISDAAAALSEALSKTGTDIVTAVNTSPGSKLHEMFQQWTAAATELKELGTRLQGTQEIVSQLQATQAAVSKVSQEIGEEAQKLLKTIRDERETSRHEAHAHHELASEVSQSTQVLGKALEGLSQRAEQFNEMVIRLQFLVDRLDGDGYHPPYSGAGR